MPESLSAHLYVLRVEQLLRAAETIRDWPECQERTDQAIRHIREAMYFCAIGKIAPTEESRVFSILAFAMPEGGSALDGDPAPELLSAPYVDGTPHGLG